MKSMNREIVKWIGNKDILNAKKTAFLCSSKYSATSVLKSYDWAREQKKLGNCVISGFHSSIEKDVFNILIEGNQPIIIVLARGMIKRLEPKIKCAIDNGRLLIITPFESSVTYITKETSMLRNELIIELADELIIAHMSKGGKLEKLIKAIDNKPIKYL